VMRVEAFWADTDQLLPPRLSMYFLTSSVNQRQMIPTIL
jgi:hypothetical protein